MKTLVLISMQMLIYAVAISDTGTFEYIFYDNEEAIIAESGSSAIIGCTFDHRADVKPTSVILMKCESRPVCGNDDIIFDSEDANAAKGQFGLLEPDLSKKNCSVRINDLSISMSGSYQIGVNGQWKGRPIIIRTAIKKPIKVTDGRWKMEKMEFLTVMLVIAVLVGVLALTAIYHCIRCRKSCRGLRDQAEATEMVISQDQQTGGRQVDGFDEQTFQDEGVAATLPFLRLQTSISPPSAQGELPPPSPSTTSSSSTPPPDFKPPPPPRRFPRLQTSMMYPPYAHGDLPPPPPPPPQCFPRLQTSMMYPPYAHGDLPPPPPPPPQCFPRLQTSICSQSLHGPDPVLHQSPAEVDLPLLHQSPASVRRGRRVTFAAASSSSRRRVKTCTLSTTDDEDEPYQSAYF